MAEKVDKTYWDDVWQPAEIPRAVMPEIDTLRNHSHHRFHSYFDAKLRPAAGSDRRLIEFGCAQSAWLSYFARHLGFAVTGIDYSERGCAKAKAVLRRDGVAGEIVHADFTAPPPRLLDAFDVGVSFGVAEHFEDTAECLAAFRRFLKPGGRLLTVIPNLAGSAGALQRLLSRKIYDIHVVIDREALADAHRRAGLEVLDCRYIECSNFGIVTIEPGGSPVARVKRMLRLALMGLSFGTWIVDRYLLRLPETRVFSPYLICAARKPEG
ncbi:MAG: class I SAM-dependent methyltransferase [Acidobacteriota bacterium]